jgi:hypothetical protein
MSIFIRARRLGFADDGNVAVIFALVSPILIGAAAFAVETSYWYYKDLQLQAAADAAAYAAAIDQRAGRTRAEVAAAATAQASSNGFDAGHGTITVNTPPTSGANQVASAVEVVLDQHENRLFTGIFTAKPVTARARAVARYQTASNACVLALSASASQAAWFAGSSNLTLNGCSVMSNSVATDAVKVQGSARLSTDCVISAGGVVAGSGLTMRSCSSAMTQQAQVADPFASVPAPSTSGACQNGAGAALTPGKYCAGLSLSGDVALAPGVYVISGGSLKINANANVTGTGVTFYLTNGARLQFNGNATMNLSAPTSGTYAGMLFFGDRTDQGGSNTLNGTANSKMTGAVYFAKQQVQYLGNFSGVNGCTQVVADTVQWSGNTTVAVDCAALGMQPLPAMQLVKLVE